jgi:predicted ABC-type ATPase
LEECKSYCLKNPTLHLKLHYPPAVLLDLSNRPKKRVIQLILFIIGLTAQNLLLSGLKFELQKEDMIPIETIIRRYYSGLKNFIDLYKNKVDYWMLIDNSNTEPELIAEGRIEEQMQVKNLEKWEITKKLKNDANRD